ncbi:MAG: HAD-IIB family hydrolase [Clostridia bacterium]|nr:HAD-IIB family hydrolase [Clostridia bacterium]
MKIIASDYDGTVNCNGISQRDAEAITKFREAGNKFGIVTGRDLDMALWVLFEFKKVKTKIDFLICCTGAIILNGDGEIIKIKKGKVLPEHHEMIKKARELGVNSFNFNDGLKRIYIDPNGKIPYDLDCIPEFTQLNVWFMSNESADKFNAYINENYANVISAYRNGGSVDMPPANTSKVTGIYDYASQFDSPEIYTVGDNLNDIPMIEEFCGFAVSNAQDAVKKSAKHQCDRVADMIEIIMEEK